MTNYQVDTHQYIKTPNHALLLSAVIHANVNIVSCVVDMGFGAEDDDCRDWSYLLAQTGKADLVKNLLTKVAAVNQLVETVIVCHTPLFHILSRDVYHRQTRDSADLFGKWSLCQYLEVH